MHEVHVGAEFAIETGIVGKLSGLSKSINDRFMTLTLPLSGNKHATDQPR